MIADLNYEECIVLEIYMKKDRAEVLADMKEALPMVEKDEDENMKEVLESVILKVEVMTDEEYDELDTMIVPSYTEADPDEN